jgi:hypothetical protein
MPRSLSAAILTASIVASIGIGALTIEWYYVSYAPGTLYLSVLRDGPWIPDPNSYCPDCLKLDPTILTISANLTLIRAHLAGEAPQTGWRTLLDSTDGTVPFVDSLSRSIQLTPGIYDELMFNVSGLKIDIQNVGNATFTLDGGGFTPLFFGGRFRVLGSQVSGVDIVLRFNSTEIHAESGPLHAVSYMEDGFYP